MATQRRYIEEMDEETDATRQAPQHWLDRLEAAQAEIEAGRAIDGAAMRQRLRDSLARLAEPSTAK
jgi:hypothetical protein